MGKSEYRIILTIATICVTCLIINEFLEDEYETMLFLILLAITVIRGDDSYIR